MASPGHRASAAPSAGDSAPGAVSGSAAESSGQQLSAVSVCACAVRPKHWDRVETGPSCPLFFVLRDSGCCCSLPTDGRYLSKLRTKWWIRHSPHFIDDIKCACDNDLALATLFLSMSQAAAVFIFCLKLLSVSLPGVWLLTQTTEPETKTVGAGVISLLPAGAGNIISASRPDRGRAAGRQRKSGPGWFYYRRGLWLRPTSCESEMTTRKHLLRYQMSLSQKFCCGARPRVSPSQRCAHSASDSRIIFS